ncbi:MAG: thiamine diphosphokinase [Firmicutes bacterium]|nr:thiamine diphosphokinase [Bacillota bacterium]
MPFHFSSVVVLNGTPPRGYAAAVLWSLSQQKPRPQIIAADGGGGALLAQNIWPDILIGDGDSLDEDKKQLLLEKGVQRIDFPRAKNFGDGEAAMRLALENHPGPVAVFGAFGGRLDFTILNLTAPLLFGPEQARKFYFFGHDSLVRYIQPGEDLIQGRAGDHISLIAMTPQVTELTINGFVYPLTGYTLEAGSSRAVSNIIAETPARISYKDGQLLMVHYRKEDDV